MTVVDPMTVCGAKTRKGSPCQQRAGHGTQHPGVGRCSKHGGASPNAEVAGQVQLARREAAMMGVPLDIEPHEAILECIRIAAGEVQYASDRIAELDPSDAVGPVVTRMDRPLKEEKGAESAEHRVEEVTEGAPALHIWIITRRQAMDRLVNYSAAALKAGIQKRLIEITEGQAQQLARAYEEFARLLGHQPADPKVRGAMRASLTLIKGGVALAADPDGSGPRPPGGEQNRTNRTPKKAVTKVTPKKARGQAAGSHPVRTGAIRPVLTGDLGRVPGSTPGGRRT